MFFESGYGLGNPSVETSELQENFPLSLRRPIDGVSEKRAILRLSDRLPMLTQDF